MGSQALPPRCSPEGTALIIVGLILITCLIQESPTVTLKAPAWWNLDSSIIVAIQEDR